MYISKHPVNISLSYNYVPGRVKRSNAAMMKGSNTTAKPGGKDIKVGVLKLGENRRDGKTKIVASPAAKKKEKGTSLEDGKPVRKPLAKLAKKTAKPASKKKLNEIRQTAQKPKTNLVATIAKETVKLGTKKKVNRTEVKAGNTVTKLVAKSANETARLAAKKNAGGTGEKAKKPTTKHVARKLVENIIAKTGQTGKAANKSTLQTAKPLPLPAMKKSLALNAIAEKVAGTVVVSASTDNRTTLQCTFGRKLAVVGQKVLGDDSKPVPAASRSCRQLDAMLTRVRRRCDGRVMCTLDQKDLHVTKKQCSGVTSVYFDVRCQTPAGKF